MYQELIVLKEYRKHVAERAAERIVRKPLDATQMAALVWLLKNPPAREEEFLLDLLSPQGGFPQHQGSIAD